MNGSERVNSILNQRINSLIYRTIKMFLDQRTWFFLFVFCIVSLVFAITTAFHYSMFLFFSQLFTLSFILFSFLFRPNAIVHQTSDAASFRFFCNCFYIHERYNLIHSLTPATLRLVNSVRNQVRFFANGVSL